MIQQKANAVAEYLQLYETLTHFTYFYYCASKLGESHQEKTNKKTLLYIIYIAK